MKDKIVLLDISGIIHRVYHSLNVNKFRRSTDNLPTNAIFGCIKIILNLNKTFKDYKLVACLDNKRESLWRKQLAADYKQNRSQMKPELSIQFKFIEEALECLNIKSLKIHSYEADDVIASICHQNPDSDIIVASSDKDMYQLLSLENVQIYNPQKKIYITREDCKTKFDVQPEQFTFYQALVGDSSDNIKGIKGIGPKTASKLVNKYNTFENFCNDKDNKYESFVDSCKVDYKLVTLSKDIKFTQEDKNFTKQNVKSDKFKSFCKEMEFNSIKF